MATVLKQGQVHVDINLERCAGCQECIIRCPMGALSLDPAIWKASANDAACVGCRQCVRTCPFSAITVEGPLLVLAQTATPAHSDAEVLGNTEEVHKGYDSWNQALKEADRCLACPDPTCVLGCPAHNDIPGFIEAIRQRDLPSAHNVLARTTMMPDICSRVCDQSSQCEGACSLKLAGGQPVAIGLLERFITDQTPVPPPSRESADGKGLKVAVVGAGPAGMSAAWTLLKHGADVTLFEKDGAGLGVLRWGIPSFSLPDQVADRPLRALTASGAKVYYGTEVKPEDMDGLLATYDAMVLAHGAALGISVPVPGRDLQGVVDATSFLTKAKDALREGRSLKEIDGTRILVVGAGNTAMDVARSARRLGATEVTAVDWVDARFAKVRLDELMQAKREGVNIRFQTQVLELVGSDHIEGAVLAATQQRRASELPKRTPAPPERITVDMVVMAVGYRPDPALGASIGTKLPLRPKTPPAIIPRRLMAAGLSAPEGRVMVQLVLKRDQDRAEARQPQGQRVWAVGDALTGPQTVVTAMAQGREAAQAILAAKPQRGAHTVPPVLAAK